MSVPPLVLFPGGPGEKLEIPGKVFSAANQSVSGDPQLSNPDVANVSWASFWDAVVDLDLTSHSLFVSAFIRRFMSAFIPLASAFST